MRGLDQDSEVDGERTASDPGRRYSPPCFLGIDTNSGVSPSAMASTLERTPCMCRARAAVSGSPTGMTMPGSGCGCWRCGSPSMGVGVRGVRRFGRRSSLSGWLSCSGVSRWRSGQEHGAQVDGSARPGVWSSPPGPARHPGRLRRLVPQCGLTAAGRRRCAGTHLYRGATAKSRQSPGTPLSS